MKTLKQVTKVTVDTDKIRALCVTMKGATIAFDISLTKNPKYQRVVNDFATKILEILEEELG